MQRAWLQLQFLNDVGHHNQVMLVTFTSCGYCFFAVSFRNTSLLPHGAPHCKIFALWSLPHSYLSP